MLISLVLLSACANGPPATPTMLGEAALSQGDWQKAKTHFAEALRIDSNVGRAWLGQAHAQWLGRDPEGSLRSLSSLSKIDRKLLLSEARSLYADSLQGATEDRLRRKKSELALVSVRALSKLDPDRRGLASLLGRVLIGEAERWKWAGDGEKALSFYREACVVVPDSLESWVGAAEILLKMGDGREAIRLLAVARKRHPTAGSIRTLTIQALSLR
jgi:tetratricopeptide (TPR) repeat protein